MKDETCGASPVREHPGPGVMNLRAPQVNPQMLGAAYIVARCQQGVKRDDVDRALEVTARVMWTRGSAEQRGPSPHGPVLWIPSLERRWLGVPRRESSIAQAKQRAARLARTTLEAKEGHCYLRRR